MYVKQKYNQDTDGLSQLELESVGDKMPNWEPAADRGLWALSDPRLSSPVRMRKKCCYGQKNLGQYVAVRPRLQLTSHTQPTSTLSRIKCERYIFIKKCVRSFIEVVIIVDYVSAYICICICMWLYNTNNQPTNMFGFKDGAVVLLSSGGFFSGWLRELFIYLVLDSKLFNLTGW